MINDFTLKLLKIYPKFINILYTFIFYEFVYSETEDQSHARIHQYVIAVGVQTNSR